MLSNYNLLTTPYSFEKRASLANVNRQFAKRLLVLSVAIALLVVGSSIILPQKVHATSPYFQVYGGDVQAGSGLDSNCDGENPNAKILTFNQGVSPFGGAGTRMAVFAMDTITGFASQKGGPGPANALSFANDPPSAKTDTTYGGGFGHTFCAPAYAIPPITTPIPVASREFTYANGEFLRNGPLEITETTVHNGYHTAVYVNGDVFIKDKIVYASDGSSWANFKDIPSFYLIVRGGNINIHKSVTNLDGVYVAIPDATGGGTIYTCTNDGGLNYSVSIPTGDCNTTLTVNGSFIANKIKFLRKNGDVTNSTASEVFIYGPEMWVR